MPRLAVFFILLCALRGADLVRLTAVPQDLFENRFARIEKKNPAREAALVAILAEAGCKDDLLEQLPVKGSKLPNLSCTLKGESLRTIIVSAHYDNAGQGDGAIDNWSGASMIPSLFESISKLNRRFTFRFLLFTDEEKGLIGSTDFVKHLSKEEIGNIMADINIDSVGLPAINVWASRADPKLLQSAYKVAEALHLKLAGVNVDQIGDSDSHPFLLKKIPVIDFHSITTKTWPLLHSPNDVRAAIDATTYYDTYRLIALLLSYLNVQTQ